MARRLPELGERRLSELKEAWKSERRDWARQRLRVMRLVARHEHSAQEIADLMGVSRGTVFNYLRVFEEKGVEGLLQRDYGIGRPGLIGGRLQRELVEKLRCGAFVQAKDAQRWLRECTGRTLSLNALYYHLGKVGGVLRVPRKTHMRKDEAQVAAFREEAAERLLALIERTMPIVAPADPLNQHCINFRSAFRWSTHKLPLCALASRTQEETQWHTSS